MASDKCTALRSPSNIARFVDAETAMLDLYECGVIRESREDASTRPAEVVEQDRVRESPISWRLLFRFVS